MSCEEIRDQLVETARGRELSSDLRQIVFSHAAVCAGCASRLSVEQKLTGALADLAAARPAAPARLERAILQQLPVVAIRRSQPPRPVWAYAAGIAAALAVALLLAKGRLIAPSATHPLPAAAAKVSATADADGFVPLPFAPELTPGEPAEMVRVELPRETLLSMGYPVLDDFDDEQMEADVLLGMDGTARAIRVAN